LREKLYTDDTETFGDDTPARAAQPGRAEDLKKKSMTSAAGFLRVIRVLYLC
jgi:hypothetical protein